MDEVVEYGGRTRRMIIDRWVKTAPCVVGHSLTKERRRGKYERYWLSGTPEEKRERKRAGSICRAGIT